jgi:hypothetical protein
MNTSAKHMTVATGRPLFSLWGFARTAALASFGAALPMFLCAAMIGNQRVWEITAILCASTIAAICTVTLAIGCLVMLTIAGWRLLERIARRRRAGLVAASQLWDPWIDEPER